jgi:hypothetical protein
MIGCILISLGLTVGVGSGKPSPEPTPTATPPLAVTIGAVAPVRIFVGHETTITIPVRVADGHRVQANPASNEFLVPLQLEFEEVDGLVFGPAVYPKSEPYLLHGGEEVLSCAFRPATPACASFRPRCRLSYRWWSRRRDAP